MSDESLSILSSTIPEKVCGAFDTLFNNPKHRKVINLKKCSFRQGHGFSMKPFTGRHMVSQNARLRGVLWQRTELRRKAPTCKYMLATRAKGAC